MATSIHELRGMIGPVDNDNQPRWRVGSAGSPSIPDAPGGGGSVEHELSTLTSRLDARAGILWAEMHHDERACFTPALVDDSRELQLRLKAELHDRPACEMPFRYLVWTSGAAGAFSLGGDLGFFTRSIRAGDRTSLTAYAYRCIDVLCDNYYALDLPILTVALVKGDAMGGGLESMLTNDIVIAERDTRFGLPEILFNLFPGMGGFSFLKRRLGERQARQLIEDGCTRSAEELHAMGLIDIVCEPGQGEAALDRFVAENARRFSMLRTLRRACRRVDPVGRQELLAIVDLWLDLAMELGPTDLRRMDTLARLQERRRAAH
jgi:DSF synthase